MGPLYAGVDLGGTTIGCALAEESGRIVCEHSVPTRSHEGPQAVLQMFATSSPSGTLLLRLGQEEGVICFEGGLLILAQLGGKTGMKALVRMLSWREGVFEFRAAVEDRQAKEAPLPLEAALFDAVRQIDEGSTVEQPLG